MADFGCTFSQAQRHSGTTVRIKCTGGWACYEPHLCRNRIDIMHVYCSAKGVATVQSPKAKHTCCWLGRKEQLGDPDTTAHERPALLQLLTARLEFHEFRRFHVSVSSRNEDKHDKTHLLKAAQLADALNGRRVIIFEGCFVSQEQKPNVRSINFEEAGSCSTVLGA